MRRCNDHCGPENTFSSVFSVTLKNKCELDELAKREMEA